MIPSQRLVATLLLLGLAGCSSERMEGEQADQPLPRPVKVFAVRELDPSTRLAVTGSLDAWKSEEIGFQVAGRIEKIYFESGENIEGRTYDESGARLTDGDTIAALESRRYELALSSALAQFESALARYEALATEIREIVPKRINAAAAREKFARQEYARIETLYRERGGTVTRSQLDSARSDRDTAEADLQEQQESAKVKRAELKALKATAEEAAEAVEQAEKDLADTRLTSPYDGQVAAVTQIEGGFVQPGQPVVRVQMMDPLQIEVSVSPETDRQVNLGDIVNVFLDENSPPMEAYVWFKDTVADPSTRTFRLQLLVRNKLIESGLPEGAEAAKLYRAGVVSKPFTESVEREPPFYVAVGSRRRTLYEDSNGFFVWRVVESSPRVPNVAQRFDVEKVRVKPGSARLPYLQVATFLELADMGELDPNDLIVGDIRKPDGTRLIESGYEPPSSIREDDAVDDALDSGTFETSLLDDDDLPRVDPSPADESNPPGPSTTEDAVDDMLDADRLFEERQRRKDAEKTAQKKRVEKAREDERQTWDEIGDTMEVVYVQRRWMLRPGDYVRVDLTGSALPEGLYVPMDAIVESNGSFHVVVAESAETGTVARHVPVTVTKDAFVDTMRHVAPVEEGGLSVGTRIVATGAYYVVDGEPLAIAGEVTRP